MASILLVADDRWVGDAVAAAITDPGVTLEVLDDPKRVVERVQESLPDLVVVDLQVGAMGGMAITRELQDAIAIGEVERMPILMLLDRSADVFLARRAGAEAHLVKPFTSQDFRAVVGSLAAGVG